MKTLWQRWAAGLAGLRGASITVDPDGTLHFTPEYLASLLRRQEQARADAYNARIDAEINAVLLKGHQP